MTQKLRKRNDSVINTEIASKTTRRNAQYQVVAYYILQGFINFGANRWVNPKTPLTFVNVNPLIAKNNLSMLTYTMILQQIPKLVYELINLAVSTSSVCVTRLMVTLLFIIPNEYAYEVLLEHVQKATNPLVLKQILAHYTILMLTTYQSPIQKAMSSQWVTYALRKSMYMDLLEYLKRLGNLTIPESLAKSALTMVLPINKLHTFHKNTLFVEYVVLHDSLIPDINVIIINGKAITCLTYLDQMKNIAIFDVLVVDNVLLYEKSWRERINLVSEFNGVVCRPKVGVFSHLPIPAPDKRPETLYVRTPGLGWGSLYATNVKPCKLSATINNKPPKLLELSFTIPFTMNTNILPDNEYNRTAAETNTERDSTADDEELHTI